MPFESVKGSRRQSAILFILAILILVATISQLCGYRIRRDGYVVDLSIITMLTPSGLIDNLALGGHPELHRFYFRASERAGVWENPPLAGAVAATVLLAGFWLWREGRRRRA